MPKASVPTTAAVSPGLRVNVRAASLRSRPAAASVPGIEPGDAPNPKTSPCAAMGSTCSQYHKAGGTRDVESRCAWNSSRASPTTLCPARPRGTLRSKTHSAKRGGCGPASPSSSPFPPKAVARPCQSVRSASRDSASAMIPGGVTENMRLGRPPLSGVPSSVRRHQPLLSQAFQSLVQRSPGDLPSHLPVQLAQDRQGEGLITQAHHCQEDHLLQIAEVGFGHSSSDVAFVDLQCRNCRQRQRGRQERGRRPSRGGRASAGSWPGLRIPPRARARGLPTTGQGFSALCRYRWLQ